MLAVVRIDETALEVWSSRRRATATPPLVVTADVPLARLRERMRAIGLEAFVVDVTGCAAVELVGSDAARLPGPGHIGWLEPFLQKAREGAGLLEVVLLDRGGLIDAARLPSSAARRGLAGHRGSALHTHAAR